MDSITVIVPMPSPKLSPNARIHWAAKSKLTKRARALAYQACLAELGRKPSPAWRKARAALTFYFKTAHRIDPDNAVSRLKATFDGIADAGIVENDRDLWPERPVFLKDAKNPRVEITITPELN